MRFEFVFSVFFLLALIFGFNNSNTLSVTHPNETNTLRDTASTWDALNRLTGETSADVSHSYTLDKAGNRLTTTYGQTGLQIVPTYDPLNRLATLTEGSRATTYAYNLNGSIVEKVLPNDVTVACTFDLLGRKTLSTNTADGAVQPFAQYNYQHDKQGNLVEIDESYPLGNLTARIVTNPYDKVYRLDTETIAVSGGSTTVTDYDYNDAHNRSQKSVIVDAGTPVTTSYAYGDGSTASTANSNQLVSFTEGSNTVSFTYDANGNRATRTESSQTDTYSYDHENRLLGLDYQTGSSDTGLYEYAYDDRTRRTVRDESAITGRNKDLIVFSGGTSAQEHSTSISSSPEVENIRGSDYGGGIGGILYSLRSGVPSIKHYNSRGDVVAATDASGSLTYQAAYEAFGKHGDTPSSQEWGNTADRQQANTKDEDPTGLLNEGFRYRDLETGTFITRDPLGFVDGPNVYTYVVQNPWTKFDPLGLYSWKEYKQDFSAGLSSISEFASPTVETGGAMLNLANDYTGALMNSLSGGLVFDSHAASFEQSAKDIVVGTANQVSQLSTDAQGALDGLGQGDLSGVATMVNNFVGYEEGDSGEKTAGKFFTAGLPFGKIKGLNVPEVSKKIPAEKLKYKPKNRGNAPIGDDGKPVELHHNDQSLGNQSSRSEMTRTDHRGPGNFKKNHPSTGQNPSTVDRAESSKQHRKHWEQEFDSGRFDDLPEQ